MKSKPPTALHFIKWRDIISTDKNNKWRERQVSMRRIRNKIKLIPYFNKWKGTKEVDASNRRPNKLNQHHN